MIHHSPAVHAAGAATVGRVAPPHGQHGRRDPPDALRQSFLEELVERFQEQRQQHETQQRRRREEQVLSYDVRVRRVVVEEPARATAVP